MTTRCPPRQPTLHRPPARLRATHLPAEAVAAPVHLTMQHTPRPRRLELVQPLDRRYPRDTEVPRRHDNSIKPLDPPLIPTLALALALALPPQRDLPLPADPDSPLDSSAVRHEVRVAVAVPQALDVAPQDRPVAEGCVYAVPGDGPLAALGGDVLCAAARVAHGHVVDVGLEVRVDGGLAEARLGRPGCPGRDGLGDGHGRITLTASQCREVGQGRWGF